MLKERLSKISIRIFYVIFAIIVSLALWFYVEITENEIQVIDISSIEIVFKNEEVLRDRGLLITSVTPETLTFRVEGSRSDIARLASPGALAVEVDLANVSSAGPIDLVYEDIFPPLVNFNAVEITRRSTTRITIVIDMILERPIEVKVPYTGGLASADLVTEEVEFDPHWITVWGPERIVSRIQHILVPINRENLATTYRDELEFLVIDDNDEVMDATLRDSLIFSQDTVWVTVPVREIKEIPLVVILAHGASTSEVNTLWHATPSVVKVSGDPEALSGFNNILLGTINMLSIERSDATVSFPIVIPNHITNISGETEAIVHVEIIGLDIAFRSTSNINVINVPSGYRADILTQTLDIRIRGLTDELAQVTPMNLRVVANLADESPGNVRISATVYVDGFPDIDPVGEYYIHVSIVPEDN